MRRAAIVIAVYTAALVPAAVVMLAQSSGDESYGIPLADAWASLGALLLVIWLIGAVVILTRGAQRARRLQSVDACPKCRAARLPGASQCSVCGASFDPAA